VIADFSYIPGIGLHVQYQLFSEFYTDSPHILVASEHWRL